MADNPAAEIQLLKSQKVKLIDILSGDADFVLQHADSRCLLSPTGYQQVKACRVPCEKVTELLDHIILRGPEAVRGLLKLLNEPALQETFPMLSFTKDLHVDTLSSGIQETSRKRKPAPDLEDSVPSKQISNNGSSLVKEKQLLIVARAIGKSWREIGAGHPLCEAGTDRRGPLAACRESDRHAASLEKQSKEQSHSFSPALAAQSGRRWSAP